VAVRVVSVLPSPRISGGSAVSSSVKAERRKSSVIVPDSLLAKDICVVLALS
jgi:hypothetical protein